MTFKDWAETVFLATPRDKQVARAAWNAAIDAANGEVACFVAAEPIMGRVQALKTEGHSQDHSGLPGDDKGFPTMEDEEDHAREGHMEGKS